MSHVLAIVHVVWLLSAKFYNSSSLNEMDFKIVWMAEEPIAFEAEMVRMLRYEVQHDPIALIWDQWTRCRFIAHSAANMVLEQRLQLMETTLFLHVGDQGIISLILDEYLADEEFEH